MEFEEMIIACERIGKNPHEVEYFNKAQLFDLIKFVTNFEIEDCKTSIDAFKDELANRKFKSEKKFNETQRILLEKIEDLKLYELILTIITTQYNKVKDLPIGPPAKVTDTSISNIVEIDKTNHTQETTPPGPETKLPKIKWCGKPSHLAYLINELIENGFIDAPKTKGDTSYKKMAELIMRTFEVETTEQNMQKELNPNKNTVGDVNRLRFKIPSISELD